MWGDGGEGAAAATRERDARERRSPTCLTDWGGSNQW